MSWHSGSSSDSISGDCTRNTSSTWKNESKLAGAGPASNTAISVSKRKSSSGASSHTVVSIGNQTIVAVSANLAGKHTHRDVDEGEAVEGAGGRDGEDVAGVNAGGESKGQDAVEGDQIETVEGVGILVERIADIAAHWPWVPVLRNLTTVRPEGSSGGREGQPGKPNSSEISCCTDGDLDGELGALEVGGADRNLHGIRRNIETVNEGPNDRVVWLAEGRVDVSVCDRTVAWTLGLDVVCIRWLLPTLKYPTWIWGFLDAQKLTRSLDHTGEEKSNWKATCDWVMDEG